jgi:hypothetical protein
MNNSTTTAPSQNKKWYIRFNKGTGRILGIGPRPLTVIDEFEQVTSSTNIICKDLIAGRKNINKYAIHWDVLNDEWGIDVKSSTLELKTKGEKLNQLKENDHGACDVYVKVIRATDTIKIEVNLGSIKHSLNLGQINSIKNDNSSILDLYLCRENDPDYLVGIIPVDAINLITDTYLYIQVPSSITRHINSWNEISFFTKPVFSSYGIEYTDIAMSQNTDDNERPCQFTNATESAHINIYTLNGKLIINSGISLETMYYFDSKSKLILYVSDKEIDNYTNTLTLNTTKLVNNKIEMDLPDNWPVNPIISFKNKQLTVNYYGEKDE